jgi:hypothetical protein
MMHKKGGRRKRWGVNISEERETEFPATKPKRMDTKKKEGFPKKKRATAKPPGTPRRATRGLSQCHREHRGEQQETRGQAEEVSLSPNGILKKAHRFTAIRLIRQNSDDSTNGIRNERLLFGRYVVQKTALG